MIFRFSIGIRLQPYITQYDFLEFGLSLGTILKLGFLIKYGTFWQYLTIILKSEFVQFEGLLAFYISKLIPMIRKLLATHLIIRLVCQGPPRPLKRGLRAPGGPLKCEFINFKDFLVCYISKSIPVIGKLIATHLIIKLVCQGPARPHKRGLRALGGAPEMWICQVWRFVGMLYIKIDPSDTEIHWETHCNSSYNKI